MAGAGPKGSPGGFTLRHRSGALLLMRIARASVSDATMAQISRENGGPGVVVGTVVQRAHYFGVSKTLNPITDPKDFKGLKVGETARGAQRRDSARNQECEQHP